MPTVVREFPMFGGRWQPFHRGHGSVVSWVLAQSDEIVIPVVNPDPLHPFDEDFDRFRLVSNPLNYWQRLVTIRAFARAEGIWDRVTVVPTWHPRVSLERDGYYFPPKHLREWLIPCITDDEEAKSADLRDRGETVRELEHIEQDWLQVNGTQIRTRLKSNDRVGLEGLHSAVADLFDLVDTSTAQWRCAEEGQLPVFVGRFQIFHLGHAAIVRRLSEDNALVVVAVECPADGGSPDGDTTTAREPFNFWERYRLIRATLLLDGLWDRVVVVPLPGGLDDASGLKAFLPDERRWIVAEVSTLVAKKIVRLGRLGEPVQVLPPDEDWADVSAGAVRRAVRLDQPMDGLVSPAVVDELRGFNAQARLIDLNTRYPEEVERSETHRAGSKQTQLIAVAVDRHDLDVAFTRISSHLDQMVDERRRLLATNRVSPQVREHLAVLESYSARVARLSLWLDDMRGNQRSAEDMVRLAIELNSLAGDLEVPDYRFIPWHRGD